jgi:hypothetical protein
MSVKRSTLKAVAVALATFAIAGASSAKAAKKKDTGPEKPTGGMMEEGGKDPAEAESTAEDEGNFVPGREKKQHEAEKKAEQEEEGVVAPEPAKKKGPPIPRKTIGVFAEGLLGLGKAPLPGPPSVNTPDDTTGSSTSFAILVGGHYDLTPAFRLMLRVPWTIGTVKTGGQDTSINALGNPELAARLRLSEPGDTEWAVRLGVGVPVAQGNTNFPSPIDANGQAQNLLQRVADAANGWHDQELYALKRLPITPALLVSHHADRLRINGELKAAIMPKIGGTISSPITGGTLELPSTALNVVLGGSVSYEVFTHAHIALAAWARYGAEQVSYSGTASTPSPLQFVAEPKLLAQFGHVVPSLGFVIPIAGQLGGDIFGLRLHIDVIF